MVTVARSQGMTTTSTLDAAYQDFIDQVPDLFFPLSMITYSRMRTDTKLAQVLAGYSLPLRRAAWAIDPAGCRPEVVTECSRALGLPILGGDGSVPGNPGIRWAQHIRLACLQYPFGFSPFVKKFDTSSGDFARLVAVQERLPVTIEEIVVDENTGDLLKVVQNAAGMAQAAEIYRKDLVWYAHDREGGQWQGRSLLRPAYAPWLIKHEMMRVHGTAVRRWGVGIPTVEAPANATPALITQAEQLATQARGGEIAGVGLPNGFRLRIQGLDGVLPDALAFIAYCDQQMTASVLLQALDLGQTAHGSRALGDTFVDLYMLALQAEADEIADTTRTEILGDVVGFNWGESEPVPRIHVADVGSRHEVTFEALSALFTAGALSWDAELEDSVRHTFGLPARPEGAPPPVKDIAPVAPKPSAASEPPPFRRSLTDTEAAARTDFAALDQSWTDAVDKLVKEFMAAYAPAAIKQATKAVEAAAESGDLTSLTTLSITVPGLQAFLVKHMTAMAEDAAQQQVDEAAAQGVDVDVPTVDADRIAAVAATTAGLIEGAIAGSAAKKATQAWTVAATAQQVAADVADYMKGLSLASSTELLQGAITSAMSSGRLSVLQEAPTAHYFASEIMDDATCDACAELDGQEFDSIDDAEAAYGSGGYTDCEGGLRCRGVIVTVWDQGEAAA